MATKLFVRDTSSTYHLGTNTAKADTTTTGWNSAALSTSAGSGLATLSTATVTGATNGVEMAVAGKPFEWFSEPLGADITISGTVTFNVWMAEDNMSANVGAQVIVERVTSTGALSTISNSEKGTEVPVTTRAAQNWTATPTPTAMKRGDRIRVRVLGNDVGTMATGFLISFGYNGTTGGSDGDTWVQFTENLTFESDPAGSQLFLTDTASDVATADIDREAWTSRGSGSVDDVTNTAAGWTSPIQVTDTAGGTAVTWWTKRLSAFTLGGKTTCNIRGKQSALGVNASLKVEIAICNSDGSGASVWGSACGLIPGSGASLTTTDSALICYVSGADTSVSNGQRLRIRVFVDDTNSNALTAGQTVTTTYSGTSGGAAGDTYVTLQQTVTEYSAVSEANFDPLWRGMGSGVARGMH